MITNLTRKDIPLQVLDSGYIDINEESTLKVLRRVLGVSIDKIKPLYEFAYNHTRLPIPPENSNLVKEYISEFVRVIKVQARALILKENLSISNIEVINPKDYYDESDIHASFTIGSYLNIRDGGSPYIDVTGITSDLVRKGILIPGEVKDFSEELIDYVSKHEGWEYAKLTWERNEFERRVRRIVVEYIDDFIENRFITMQAYSLMDTVVKPYIIVNDENNVVVEESSVEKARDLMAVLGYGNIHEDVKENIKDSKELLERLMGELQSIVDSSIDSDDRKDDISLNLYVNLGFINALFLNALDGNHKAEDFNFDLVSELEFSQTDVEQYFFDASLSVIQFDELMTLAKSITGKSNEELFDSVTELTEYIRSVLERAIQKYPNEPYEVFKMVRNNLRVETDFIKKKFQEEDSISS